MSNQMRKAVLVGFFMSVLSLGLSLAVLMISGEFLHAISWIVVGVSIVASLILISLYIEAKKEENALRARIAYYKLVHALREKALLEFYKKFGIAPQYSKDGRLLTPDEVLGILTKLNEKGQLDESVYEMLGILPRFDASGKEIPRIMVLKHLIKAIKKENFDDIKKLKGLHKKGAEKTEEKGKDKPKQTAKKEEAKAGGGKGKGGDGLIKIDIFGAKHAEKETKSSKGKDSKPEVKKTTPLKEEPKKPEKKEEVKTAKPETKAVETGGGSGAFENKDSYLRRMWEGGVKKEEKTETTAEPSATIEEYGEGTFE